MSEMIQVEYGRHRFDVAVVRRPRVKTLGIIVAPDGSVRVAAPHSVDAEFLRHRLKKRAAWILKKRRFYEQFPPRTPPRQYVSGETHLYLGRQYRLRVAAAAAADAPGARVCGEYIHINATDKHPPAALLRKWYRERAWEVFSEMLPACAKKFYDLPRMPDLRLFTMRRRWATMSSTGRLTMTPDLVRASRLGIEYVLTHELCHLYEMRHNKAFYRLLSLKMPDWKERQMTLEKWMA